MANSKSKTPLSNTTMTTKPEALAQLCLDVLPIWGRQLATSRAQSESAVGEMLDAFAALRPQLVEASRQSTAIAYAMGDAAHPTEGPVGLRALAATCEHQLSPLLNSLDEAAAAPVRSVLELVRQTVANLEEAVVALPLDAHMVSAKMEQMCIGFQYQDRVNQVMTLLQEDIVRMHQALQSPQDGPQALAVAPWLERLESFYAMAEQHRDHSQGNITDASPGEDSETTFF